MNNYYTLKHLVHELKPQITGMRFRWACTPRQNVLEVGLQGDKDSGRIIIDTGRPGQAFFLDQYQPPPASNTIFFFKTLENKRIHQLNLAYRDRMISLLFENGLELRTLLYGSDANVFLVDEGRIREAFLNGSQWMEREPPEVNSAPENRSISPEMTVKQIMLRVNPLLPRNYLGQLIRQHSLESKSKEEIIRFTQELTNLLAERPEPRLLSSGELCLISRDQLPAGEIKTFDTVNDAVRFIYYRHLKEIRDQNTHAKILERLSNRLKSIEKQISAIADPERHLARAADYEKKGHLLMANLQDLEFRNAESVTVRDLYEDNNPLTIKLHPAKNLVENANDYYEKAARARKAYDSEKKRHVVLRNEREVVEKMMHEVSLLSGYKETMQWLKHNRDQLETIGIMEKVKNGKVLPFRQIRVDGYVVWIGKNARSNDTLTASAHKEDIWFHTRGQPGSHVVIRMNNNKDYPDKKIILKVAAIAAYNSKARGAGMVPVSYTKRKYVRKPKGVDEGTVLLEKEQVVMVKPGKPDSFS